MPVTHYHPSIAPSIGWQHGRAVRLLQDGYSLASYAHTCSLHMHKRLSQVAPFGLIPNCQSALAAFATSACLLLGIRAWFRLCAITADEPTIYGVFPLAFPDLSLALSRWL